MDSPRAALRALLAGIVGGVLIIGIIVAIKPSLVKKSSHASSTPAITFSPATSSPTSSVPTVPPSTARTTATTSAAPTTAVPPTTPAAATTVPATTATTAPPATTVPATTATTRPAATSPSKGPNTLARTGISTDPVYLLALGLILGGLTLVWLEERIRLLGLIGPMNRPHEGRRYQPQHARRRY